MKLRTLFAAVVSLAGLTVAAQAEPLAVGAAAPEVASIDQTGKPINFKDVYAKGPTLVYFYPKADTPGCTKEGCSIRDNWSDLQKAGIQVLGVSEDSIEAQKSFSDKYQFPHTLVADFDGRVASAFQVDMKGKVTSRQSFLIIDGKIVWNMLKASTDTQAKDVLAAYQGLKK